LLVANSSTIDFPNCRVVSKPIHLRVKTIEANDDVATASYNHPLNINVLANDSVSWLVDSAKFKIDTVAGSGLRHGRLTVNPDKTFTCTVDNNFFGIDSVDYRIEYLSAADTARVYIVAPKLLSVYNVACPETKIKIGMHEIPGVDCYWYTVPTGGTALSNTPTNTYTVTKDNSAVQTWYVEMRYKGRRFLRYPISVSKAEHCGGFDPAECAVDGQLLFREDFGGNSPADPRVSKTPLNAGVTEYYFKTTDSLQTNQYALVKYINPNTGYKWQKNFSDHTHLNDKNRGYMFLVDADTNPGLFYQTRITGLCDNFEQLYFSAWVVNVLPTNNHVATDDPMLRFELLDTNQNIISTYVTSPIDRTDENQAAWLNYGFPFNPKGYSELTLRIYNNASGNNGNDFALDDIEIYLCVPPVTLGNKLVDTVCLGSSTRFTASYSDDDSAFTSSGKQLAYRWEYSADENNWSIIGKDSVATSKTVRSVYVIDSVKGSDRGYYRFIVGNLSTLDNPACRVVSAAMYINVPKKYVAPDLRIALTPSTTSHKVYLSSFADQFADASIKWNSAGNIPAFENLESGTLDAQKLTSRRVYTYIYTLTRKCDSSSAKAYVLSAVGKLPVKNNKEIFVCHNLETSAHLNLTQLLGVENNGTWTYPNDTDGVVEANVKTGAAKHGSAKIFNAQKAYDEAGTSYNVVGKPATKAFRFKYTVANGVAIDLTIVVGE
jgi:hypothetical protein